MKRTRVFLPFVLFSLCVAGCSLQRATVMQRGVLVEETTINGEHIRRYHMAVDDGRRNSRIRPYEYQPVDLFVVVDERDSIRYLVATAWQEYVRRSAEKLSPVEKAYYRPMPQSVLLEEEAVAVLWGYPDIDERDRERRNAITRRNQYWSVDLFEMTGGARELFAGALRSFPKRGGEEKERFIEGGPYERALNDSVQVRETARALLYRLLEQEHSDGASR